MIEKSEESAIVFRALIVSLTTSRPKDFLGYIHGILYSLL